MTTDELLAKLPSHIDRTKFNGFYISDNKRGGDIGWIYLHNDGKDWCASYGYEGNFVCLNPDAEKPPYNNADAIERGEMRGYISDYDGYPAPLHAKIERIDWNQIKREE